jgi:putative CocE/NonD family hydrolase
MIQFGEILAEDGIVVVVQDVRGRYDSEGRDSGFFADGEDGRATLEWILAQSWSNGRAATLGGSALGITQYLLAPGAPGGLTCQWIEVATPDLYADGIYEGGVYREEMIDGWLEDIGSLHLRAAWREHAQNSEYWDPVRIGADFGDVHVPAFHIGGYFDVFARGIVDGFLGYQIRGGEGAAGHQHLVLGPWVHAINNPEVGEAVYPEAVLPELYDEWQELWLDACVRDRAGLSELDSLPAVTYFTMGAQGEEKAPGNEWRVADSWPPNVFEPQALFLTAGGGLDDVPPDDQTGGDGFQFDPAHPSPTVCGRTLVLGPGSCDQSEIEARSDILVYTSPVLTSPLEVTGDLRAEIWFTTDVPDTDIVVRLTDVYPDGRSMLVADGVMRARYRNHPDFLALEWMESDTPYFLQIDLGPTSTVFNSGHRIRLGVTSSNAPRLSVNPNTGADFLPNGGPSRVAKTTILRNAEHPSAIFLPVPKKVGNGARNPDL